VPAVAVSQQAGIGGMGYAGREFEFRYSAAVAREVIARLIADPLPAGTLLNINCPAGEPKGIEVTRLGKRLYDDELRLVEEDSGGRKRYQIYGFEPSHEDEVGTDLVAIADGKVAITPVHFDLTDHGGLERLADWDFEAITATL
jgi:5'-nucleotidase